MSWGNKVIQAIEKRRDKKQKSLPGALGDFWRSGGNELLYNVPVKTGDVVIDAGGYKGEWTAGMLIRYGCKSEIYEPVSMYAEQCARVFQKNKLVNVHKFALGKSNRIAFFDLQNDGTSEFAGKSANTIECKVLDIAEVLSNLATTTISCMKLNVEGGEYEIMERLLETDRVNQCKCFLIQFHRQPTGYERRYQEIVNMLTSTHEQEWVFPFVWEKWVLK